MSRPFLRVDLSPKDADFRSQALEPGVPVLGKSGSVSTLLMKWLGRFALGVTWQNDTAAFYVHDDEGCRFAEIQPYLATRSDLRGKLKHEFAELKDRLKNAEPQSPSAKTTHRTLCEGLLDPEPGKAFADLNCQFFKYRDVQGRWRLLWCPGLQPTIDDKPVTTAICGNPECRQLALLDGSPQQVCRRCEQPFHRKRTRPRYRRWVAALLTLALAVAGGLFLYLRPTAVLTGRIVRAADGQPVAGAEVKIGEMPPTTSDANGDFRIEKLARGGLSFEVFAPGFQAQSLDTELASGKENSTEVRLVGNGELSGSVVYVIGTRELPIPEAHVSVPSMSEKTVEADEAGGFALTDLPPGPLKLKVSADGFLPEEVDAAVSGEATEPLRVVLVGGGKLAGSVVYAADSSAAIAEAQVGVEGVEQATGQSDSEGQFELSGVPPGPIQVFAAADGFRRNVVRVEAATDPVQIPLGGDAILAGSVTRADTNQPASGAEVSLPGTPFKTLADDKGQFRLDDVCSGSSQIEATLPGLAAVLEQALPPSRGNVR